MARLPPSALPPPHLMERLRHYIGSMLLAEGLPPCIPYIKIFLSRFLQLLALTYSGKPIVHQKRKSLALMFDVFSLQSEMRLDAPDELVLGYTQSMMGCLLLCPEPHQIGMIGLGGGSLAKFCYRHLPGASISVAEIDANVIALRQQFCVPEDDERLAVHCIDGAEFVQQAPDRYDVLMVDGFDLYGQPLQLCSQRFYDDCYRALNAGGVLVVNLANDDLRETAAYLERMRHSFGDAVIVTDALDSLNTIVFCCKGGMPGLDAALLAQRMQGLGMLHPVFLRATAHSILSQQPPLTNARGRLP